MKRRLSDSNLGSNTGFLQICDSKRRSECHLTCYSRTCKDIFNKKKLVCCNKCRRCYHSDCNSNPLVYEIVIRYPWLCDRCKKCVLCKDNGNKDEDKTLVMCDACDRAFHVDCLPQKLVEVPEGKWFCDDCRYCKGCDLKLSEEEVLTNYYSLEGNKLCKKCMDERYDGDINEFKNCRDYCSVCSKNINLNGISDDVVICTKCTRGSHIKCSREEESNPYLKSQIENWICNKCYKIQLSQVCLD